MRKRAPPPCDPGATAIRLAALLRGGVPVQRAFSALAAEPEASPEVRAVAAAAEAGTPVSVALAVGSAPGWRVIAAAWTLAEESGGAFAPALELIGDGLGRLDEVRGKREALLAGPRATIRTVIALPPVALTLGWVLGFDPFSVLLSGLGVPLVAAGAGFLALGAVWARRLVAAGVGAERIGGLEFVLAGIAVSGGSPPGHARGKIADAVDRAGAEWVKFDSLRDGAALSVALRAASATGAPIATLLAAESRAHSAAALADLERDAERLGVRILLPVACCILPAFVILGVVPVIVSMFRGL